jgi:glycosyltransferase involved in cell wall biosynthesis
VPVPVTTQDDAGIRLGVVIPRYGVDVIGGAEHWMRLLCEHLVALRGWQVDVFTTGAVSAATWADELPAGESRVNGVVVHRHRSRSGRDARYIEMLGRIAADPDGVPDDESNRFIELVGPVCPDVVDDAAASACDVVALTPYVFWPVVHAAARLGRRAVLHAAAHDEPELHLPVMRSVFAAVGGFACNSNAERALVERTFPMAARPVVVTGASIAEGEGDAAAARTALGLGPDEPFVLSVGRVERLKATHDLAEFWRRYRRRRRGVPRLVLLGPVHEALVGDDDVLVVGAQPETVKWGALRACTVLVAPSRHESFGLTILEAWLAGAPVVVNGRCPATVEHCQRSGGGLWFTDPVELEVVVDRLLGDGPLRGRLAARGESYARRQFSWPAVVERYAALVAAVIRSTNRVRVASSE